VAQVLVFNKALDDVARIETEIISPASHLTDLYLFRSNVEQQRSLHGIDVVQTESIKFLFNSAMIISINALYQSKEFNVCTVHAKSFRLTLRLGQYRQIGNALDLIC
jgi:hypothetical protein